MSVVGHVRELWRYPVKSMAGERLDTARVTPVYGIPGDRAWALRDDTAGEIRGAKKLHSLVQFHARYLAEPDDADGAGTPAVEITLPDGTRVSSNDEGVHAVLSEALGRPVTLWPRQPPDDLDFYRRNGPYPMDDVRAQLGLVDGEPLPTWAAIPAEVSEHLQAYVAPLGTYFDAFSLSLITSASMTALGDASPGSVIDSRRFRQNIVADTGVLSGFIEPTWVGHELQIGTVRARVVSPISRCVMVTLPLAELPRDRSLMRTLVRETGMDLGVYLELVQPGEMSVGDPIELV